MRILITGAGGLIGGHLVTFAQDRHQVWATSRQAAPTFMQNLHWRAVDLAKRADVRALFAEAQPQVVIHCGGITDVDLAERDRDLAWNVNVEGSRYVAECCREQGARLVACSTSSVFDGEQGNYREGDPTRPVCFYGRTKVEMERLVQAMVPSWCVVRLSMVLGFSVYTGRTSPLARLVEMLKFGNPVEQSSLERRTPSDVLTIRDALLELAAGDFVGLLHLAGTTAVTRRDMALAVARRIGADPALVREPGPAPLGRAPRPRDSSLDCSRAKGVLATPLLSLEEGLARVLA